MRLKSLKRQRNRITALLLSAVCAASVFAPLTTVAENSGNIKIGTAEEFIEFAKKCKTDTWSQGKTFELTEDIDFSKTEFIAIPTFGGVFKGQGHTISGISINDKGSYIGAFRYLQPNGVIDNLHITGKIKPEGSSKYIGGIVGENSGKITGCTFSGEVSGKLAVGGICGYITKDGAVSGCDFDGSVSGESYTGGICGQNYGIIELTENHGDINTKNTEADNSEKNTDIDFDIASIEEKDKTEMINTNTDTGGICGYTKGTVSSCKNYGNVGYKSVGYNTGGICGRNAGYISKCENSGEINGRKDIGGISGQAEPNILLEYSDGILEDMKSVLSDVKKIIDDGADGAYGSEISKGLDGVNDELGNVTGGINKAVTEMSESISELSGNVEGYADDITKNVNSLTDRLDNSLERSEACFDALSNGTDKMSEGLDSFEKACEYLKKSVDDARASLDTAGDTTEDIRDVAFYLEEASDSLANSMKSLKNGTTALTAGVKKLRRAVNGLREAIEEKDAAKNGIKNSFGEIWRALGEILDALLQTEGAAEDISEVIQGLKDRGFLENITDDTVAALKKLVESYKAIGDNLIAVRDAILILAEDFDIYSFSSAFTSMNNAFNSLSRSFEILGEMSDELKSAVEKLDGAAEKLSEATGFLKTGVGQFGDGADALTGAITDLGNIVKEFNDGEAFKLPELPVDMPDNMDALQKAMNNLQNEFANIPDSIKKQKENISDSIKKEKNTIKDNLDEISNSIDMMSDMIKEAYDDKITADKDSVAEDISEYDKGGAAKGKIEDSVNAGAVNGDKNVGGIVGAMAIEYDFDPEDDVTEQGDKTLNFTYKTKCIVRKCANEGKITSKKDYAGGIVGRMDLGSIMSCEGYGEIVNENGNYTGGIAGKSKTVIRSSAVKCSISGNAYVGGIVGEGFRISDCHSVVHISGQGEALGAIAGFAEKESLKNNYCVNDEIGAIDDINYTGIAAEEDIGAFVSFVKSNFNRDTVFTLRFVADGREVGSVEFNYNEKIPNEKIPKVPDKKGYYGRWSEYDFDKAEFDAEISAEYNRNMDIISSSEKRGERSTVLVCGSFDDKARVYAYENKSAEPEAVDAYDVTIDGAYSDSYIVRYLPKTEKGHFDVFVDYGDGAEKAVVQKVGSYVQLEAAKPDFTIYEMKKDYKNLIICAAVLLLAALAMIFVLERKSKRK